jgi:hypothetical protein
MPPRTTRLTRSTPLRKRNPKTGGKRFYKIRNVRFKKWARALGCHLTNLEKPHCCRGRIEFAHVGCEGNGYPDVGNGLPLCAHSHRLAAWSIHLGGIKSFAKLFGLDLASEAARLGREWEDRT